MASPFPGMDPYLEAADIWPDFHDALANEMRGVLNQALPPPYYARLEMRPEIGVIDDEGESYQRRIVPDVTVVEGGKKTASGVALLEGPRSTISRSVKIKHLSDLGKHMYVEIRDPRRSHRLVTLIEIVSPANKIAGADRRSYLTKYNEVFHSEASIIEVDLLRGGERLLHNMAIIQAVTEMNPPPDYLVMVNRSWLRNVDGSTEVFPISLEEMLPVIPVPLREGEPEVPLDLQFVFNRAYESGPYRRGAVDYHLPAHPPLSNSRVDWAKSRLREQNVI